MNVLFIEDDIEIINLTKSLLFGHEITPSPTFFNARFCLEINPGCDTFGAVIIDLTMPVEDLPEDLQELDGLPGFIFYENILKNYPKLYKNTIFLTGFSNRLKDQIGEEKYNKLRVVRKRNDDTAKVIRAYLKDMDN